MDTATFNALIMLIQPHQKRWSQDFIEIKSVLKNALLPLDLRIEHIGSTSVPGLAAKPIIDIDIVLGKHIEFGEIKVKLEAIGYRHNGDQGVKNREAFKRADARSKHPKLDIIRHHLYVCPHHSLELQRHLIFRDTLRTNEAVRRRYEAMKYRIAKEANQENKQYANLKEIQAKEWINAVIEEART